MDRILLVFSTSRESPKSIERAIDLTKDGAGELFTLFVIDEIVADTVVKQLSEEGWIGSDPSNDVYNALQDIYMLHAEETLKEIQETADKYGIKSNSIIRQGDFEAEVLKIIDKVQISQAIITRKKRSHLSRLIFGSAVEHIKNRATCDVEIITE